VKTISCPSSYRKAALAEEAPATDLPPISMLDRKAMWSGTPVPWPVLAIAVVSCDKPPHEALEVSRNYSTIKGDAALYLLY